MVRLIDRLIPIKGNFDQGHTDVLFKRSRNSGASFGGVVNLSNNPTTLSTLQKIFVSSNKVYVVWAEGQFKERQIFFKRSIDGSVAFGNTINISNGEKTPADALLNSSGNNVYVIWDDNSTANSQIMFKRSIDGGATFAKSVSLSNSTVKGQSQYPDMVLSANNIYVVLQDRILGNIGIFFKKFT